MSHPASQSAARFTFTLPTGGVVTGPVQGNGGMIDSLDRLFSAMRRGGAGRPLGIYEPVAGCVAVYPEHSAERNGAAVIVPIAALVFCDCEGCARNGQGTCSAFSCSECGEASEHPLETLDIKDAEFGLAAYRPCATCARPTLSYADVRAVAEDLATLERDAEISLGLLLDEDFAAVGAS